MKKHFEHIFEGQIYTTRFDESANFVAVEVREAIKRTMKVYLIDVTLGEINTEISLDWWDSLVALAANRIIIQTYSTTSSTPEVIGITVFDSFAADVHRARLTQSRSEPHIRARSHASSC